MSIVIQLPAITRTTVLLLIALASSCASTDHADRLAAYDLLENERLQDLDQEASAQQADRQRAFSSTPFETAQEGDAIVFAIPSPTVVPRSSRKNSSTNAANQDAAVAKSTPDVSGRLQHELNEPNLRRIQVDLDSDDRDTVTIVVSPRDDRANDSGTPYRQAREPIPASTMLSRKQWTTGRIANPVTGMDECTISSMPHTVQNGMLRTEVRVFVTDSTLYFRTDATLDLSPDESGIRIDAGLPIRFDRLHNEVTAALDVRHEQLMRELELGTFLSINFAYQPHRGDFDTYMIEYELDGFANASAALSSCLAPALVTATTQAAG